jgi:hypothetical protein
MQSSRHFPTFQKNVFSRKISSAFFPIFGKFLSGHKASYPRNQLPVHVKDLALHSSSTHAIANVVRNGKAYKCQEYIVKDCRHTRTDCLGERMGFSITLFGPCSSLGRTFLLFLAREFK